MQANFEEIRVSEARSRITRAAWLLDDCFRVPGTSWRFGWDALLGVFPWAGDAIAALFSLWILGESWLLRAPIPVLLRMTVNAGVGFLIGLVPFIGDFFDFVWRANTRNARLFVQWTERPGPIEHGSKWWLAIFAAVLGLTAMALVGAFFWLLKVIWVYLSYKLSNLS